MTELLEPLIEKEGLGSTYTIWPQGSSGLWPAPVSVRSIYFYHLQKSMYCMPVDESEHYKSLQTCATKQTQYFMRLLR